MPTRRALAALALGAIGGGGVGIGHAADDDASTFSGRRMPYAAFDRLPAEPIVADAAGAVIRVAFAPPRTPELGQRRIVDWVGESARAVATYYGRFPARDTRLLIVTTAGRGVGSGSAFGWRGAAIRLGLGEQVGERELVRDWKLVHEMCHLALPSMPDRQHWVEEGLATYVEPLARAQAGTLDAASVWSSMLRGMPNGRPQPGDRGLEHTSTWGRTYWGGALFALLADVGIRERTGNRRGLQHAVRAILAHGNIETDSTLEPLLKIGDAAVGVPVLQELHAQMKDQPHPVDLDSLWRRLGVRLDGGGVAFDEGAPLAAVRKALTATAA